MDAILPRAVSRAGEAGAGEALRGERGALPGDRRAHDSAGRQLGFAKVVRGVTAPRELEQLRDDGLRYARTGGALAVRAEEGDGAFWFTLPRLPGGG